jgi:hypothetical protein
VVVPDLIANNKEELSMKRRTIVLLIFLAMLAINTTLVLAEDGPQPPGGPTGGCSGPECK